MEISNFSTLTSEQTKNIKAVNSTSVKHLLKNNHDDGILQIISVLKTSKTDEVNETKYFPSPKSQGIKRNIRPSDTYSQWITRARRKRTIKPTR